MFNLFTYTEKKLAKDIRDILSSIAPDLSVVYDESQSTVSLSGEDRYNESPMTINLANLFAKLRNLKVDERRERLTNSLQEFLADQELSRDELIQSLTLRTRTKAELAIRDLYVTTNLGESLKTLVLPAGDVFLEIVADREETLVSVDRATLDKVEISASEAYEISRATLARATKLDQWRALEAHIWASTYQDDYDLARVVSAGKDARLPFDGSAIIYAPSHSICLISDSYDAAVLTKMVEIGDQLSADHRIFSQYLWRREDDGNLSLFNEGQRNLAAALQVYKELSTSYTEQKNLLDQMLEKQGEDSFVANYQIYESGDGYTSMCVYTLNVPSYLPKTEHVMLFDADKGGDEGILGRLTWNEFVEIIGEQNLPEISEGRLHRYKFLNPLSGAQEAALRENAKS